MKLPFWPFKRTRMARLYIASCGHETALQGTVTVNEHSIDVSFEDSTKNIPHCLTCLGTHATSCLRCGKPILPGDAVKRSLYDPESGVICVRCLDLGTIDATGRWTEKGYIPVHFHELLSGK